MRDWCSSADDVRKASQMVHDRRRFGIFAPAPDAKPLPAEVTRHQETPPPDDEQQEQPKEDSVSILDVRPITIMSIMNAVCAFTNIPMTDLVAHRRNPKLVRWRQVAMALSTFLTTATLPLVGRYFDRDHTTVLFARRKFEPIIRQVAEEIGWDAPLSEWLPLTMQRVMELDPEAYRNLWKNIKRRPKKSETP